MRLSKKLFALVASWLLVGSAQAQGAQGTPATDDSKLREALRRSLRGEAPVPAEGAVPKPAVPATVSTSAAPRVATAPATSTAAAVRRAPSTVYTNVVYDTNGVAMVPLSLVEAIRLALERNLDLQVARYGPVISEYTRRALYGVYDPVFRSSISRSMNERESGGLNLNTGNVTPGTRSEVDQATAGLSGTLPSGMTYEFTHNAVENNVQVPFLIRSNFPPQFGTRENNTWFSSAAFTATQPLLRDLWIDSPRLQIRLARRNQRISLLALERTIMDIVNRVEQAYYGLAAAREEVRAAEADVARKREFFDQQRRRVEVGTIAPLDEKLAQAELATSESLLIGRRNAAVEAEIILKGLIRDDLISQLAVRLQLTDRLAALPTVIDLYDALREADQKRPDLQQQRLVLEKWQIQLKYDFNQLFPRLDIFGTLGYNGLDTQLGGALTDIRDRNFEQSVVGLQISVPLTMWQQRNNYKADKAAKEQAVWEYKRQTEAVYYQVENQVRLINTLWKQIPLTREVTTAREQALDAEKRKLDAGKSTSFQVLEIASDLTTAQVAEIRAMLIYNQALSELEFRKGTTLERWHIDVPEPMD